MARETPGQQDFQVLVPNPQQSYDNLLNLITQSYPMDQREFQGITFITGKQISQTPLDGHLFNEEITNLNIKIHPDNAISWQIESFIMLGQEATEKASFGYYTTERVRYITNLLKKQGLETRMITKRVKNSGSLNRMVINAGNNQIVNIEFCYDSEHLSNDFLPLTDEASFENTLTKYANIYGKLIKVLYQEEGLLIPTFVPPVRIELTSTP